jgi:Holliday junction resolvase RusA-like endonuclease
MLIIPVTPRGKPRMTRSDKWNHRDCVTRYWEFKDRLREHLTEIPQPCLMVFVFPMPESWKEKKKAIMRGQPHQKTPDIDNIEKAILDALYKNDSHIWNVHHIKIWGDEGKILIKPISIDEGLMDEIRNSL